jgi:hypothetical protein
VGGSESGSGSGSAVAAGASTGTESAVSPTASKSSAGIKRGSLHLAWGIMAVGVWIF